MVVQGFLTANRWHSPWGFNGGTLLMKDLPRSPNPISKVIANSMVFVLYRSNPWNLCKQWKMINDNWVTVYRVFGAFSYF